MVSSESPDPSPTERPVSRLFRMLAEFSVARPRTTLALGLLLGLAALALAALRLETRTSNLDLVDAGLPPVAAFRAFAEEFGSPNLLVVVLEGQDEVSLRRTVDELGDSLRKAPGVRSVYSRLPVPPGLGPLAGTFSYFASGDRRLFFVFVQPDDPYSNASTLAPLVEEVRRRLAAAGLAERGIEAGLTGTPAYALDDRDVIRRDLSRLSGLSLLAVFALFAAGFRSLRRPLLATVAVLLSVALTFGVAAIYPGHLTLLSAFFCSILFGQGIDSGIHLIAKVEELAAAGWDERRAVPAAVAALAPGIATSTLTTGGALFALLFCGFKGFAELGWLAGASLLLCLAAMVTLLPALLALFGGRPRQAGRPPGERLGWLLFAVQGRTSLWFSLAFAVAALLAGGPGYDADYTNLQPAGSETVRLEREMVRRSPYSPQFAVFRAGSREEALALTRRLRDEPLVGEVRSALDLEGLAALSGKSPAELARELPAMVSERGGWAIFAYPRDDVWQPAPQAAFAAAMLAIDPRATGLPILGRFMIERSLRAFRIAAALAALLVALLLFLDFRDLPATLAALAPSAFTAASLPFLMRLCGLAFNPLDVMALPIVLGVSVDEGVHLVHRFRDENGDLRRTLAGAGRSIILTSSTTLIGFGFLIFTEHRGLASFAAAVSLGVAAALSYSLLLLPPLLALGGRRLLRGR
jgi:uncharacterized protein